MHTPGSTHAHPHTSTRADACRHIVSTSQTHVEAQAIHPTHSHTCTKTQPLYTNTHIAQTGIPHKHMSHPPTFRHPHTQIHAHFPGSSPKAYRAAEASTSLAISSPAGQSRARAQGWGRGLSQRKSLCPAVFPIPRASSDPGCLLSSQIPPCRPQLRPAGSRKPWQHHLPQTGWSPARNTRLMKCCSQAREILPLLASAQATLPGPSRHPAASLPEGECPSARGQLLPAKTPPRCC